MNDAFDVIVIGAGPAGSACATSLAGAGLHVALLEAHSLPRHHVGESLLPASMPLLHKLGIHPHALADRFQHKYGARFYDPHADRLALFGFDAPPPPGAVPRPIPPSFQVLRSEFDALLLQRARDAGAAILEHSPVEHLDENAGSLQLADGRRLHARFIVDATGRRSLIASRRKTLSPQHDYGRLALYNYFADLPPHDSDDPNYITMYLFDAGWVWLIPLADGRTSVGVVYRRLPPVPPTAGASREAALFHHAVNQMPRLQQRITAARPTDLFRAAADFSYHIPETFGDRFVLIGDAAGFLDPIFSSGVHLALWSADRAADAVLEKLRSGDDRALHDYADDLHRGFRVFRAFVHRFYHGSLVDNLFFMPNKPPDMHAAITRILAGHVWDPDNPVLRLLGLHAPAHTAGTQRPAPATAPN